jgi:ribosomal protein S18 acetylase RimI-like enzyme
MSGEEAMIEGSGVSPAQGTVRTATSRDAAAVAALHCAAIEDGFLSTLGPAFLTRLYARIATSSNGFLLVVDGRPSGRHSDPDIAGFVAGSATVSRLYREFLWRDGPAVALHSGGRLVRSLPRVIETLRHGAARGPQPTGSSAPTGAAASETELLALAVDQRARGRGIGAALVTAFMGTAVVGSTTARVVVGADNDRAIAVYRRAGFREDRQFELHAGTPSLLMRVSLNRAPA